MKKRCALGGTLLLMLVIGLCGCGMPEVMGRGVKGDDAVSENQATGEYTGVLNGEILEAASKVQTREPDASKAVHVTLNADGAIITAIGDARVGEEVTDVSAHGLKISNGILFVESAGDYVLTGEFKGQIRIDAAREEEVHLVLDGVSITCENSSAIYGVQSDRIYITLAEGSANWISDAGSYVYEDESEDEPNAAIFSKDDLTFAGAGSLVVNGNFADGIRSKDDLVFVGGNYEVTASKDALQGKDSVCILGGNYILKSGGDAIKASNDTEEEKGYVVIDGGTFSVKAGDDGVHGESGLLINDCKMDILSCYEGLEAKAIEMNGGEITIVASDDGINAAYNTSSDDTDTKEEMGKGGPGGFDMGGGSMIPDEDCKVGITGGKITISAGGDGIDSNGYLYVAGGEVYVNGASWGADSALDCGMEAVVTGGTVVAIGNSGMATGFSEISNQCFIFYNMEKQVAAGEMLQLQDKEGNILLTYSPMNAYNSVLISCPAMTANETYTLICGEQKVEITLDGTSYSEGGSYGEPGGFRGGPGGFGGKDGFGGDPGGFGNFGDGKGGFGDLDGEFPEGREPGQRPQMR